MKNTPVRPLPGHHHLIDKLSVLNGVVTGLALYPQIYLILVSHVENTLSPMTLWLLVVNNIVWIIYGVHRSIVPVIVTGFLSGFAAVTLLFI